MHVGIITSLSASISNTLSHLIPSNPEIQNYPTCTCISVSNTVEKFLHFNYLFSKLIQKLPNKLCHPCSDQWLAMNIQQRSKWRECRFFVLNCEKQVIFICWEQIQFIYNGAHPWITRKCCHLVSDSRLSNFPFTCVLRLPFPLLCSVYQLTQVLEE